MTQRRSPAHVFILHTATSLLLIHCPHHYVFCLSYLQPHHGSLHTASTIQSSVSPTTSHILATYTLPPPFYPLSLLPLATSWLLTHCLRHTVLRLYYLQPHPCSLHTVSTIQVRIYYLQPNPGSLHIACTIHTSVSPTSHVLAHNTLRPPYNPLSLLPPATSWLLTHCLQHTVHCLSYLQPHPSSLHTESAIQSSVSPTSSHILAPDTLRPSYNPLSFLPPATPLLLTHYLHHTVLYCSYLQPNPGSLHIAYTIQSSVSPTSSHILATYTLPPPYSPLTFLYYRSKDLQLYVL